MNTALAVPSGVLTSTLFSTTAICAAAGPAAAAMPAATDIATKSRRVTSRDDSSS
jgi:hypothetical protein